MKFDNVTESDKNKIISRATGVSAKDTGMELGTYVMLLENALVQSVLNRTNQRRELNRLNQQVRHINEVSLANSVLVQEVVALNELLDRKEEEDKDTDPSQLCVGDGNTMIGGNTNVIATLNNGAEDPEAARYAEWDMKTRYHANKPRRPIYG